MLTKWNAKIVCALFTAAIAILIAIDPAADRAVASSRGPAAGRTGAPNESTCATWACHRGTPNSGSGQLIIESPQHYELRSTIQITVRHRSSDATRRRWGFQLTALAESGEKVGEFEQMPGLNVMDDNSHGPMRQYVGHTSDTTFPEQTGGASWTVNWTAPSTDVGPVTLYAGGNQANNDGTNAGDEIYTATVTLLPPVIRGPRITGASVTGKQLNVAGINFEPGAQLFMDGQKQKKTFNDETNPTTLLIAKKSGKKVPRGATVRLEVKNPDGTLSEPFNFTRPVE